MSRRTTISPGFSRPFPATALLRRFSAPSPYTVAGQPVTQASVDPATPIHDQVHNASLIPTVPSKTIHEYILTSRGREYALITVPSHASNAQDIPLLYFGEELKGFVVLSLSDLNDMQSMGVVLQMFDSDPITPSYEAKRVLQSQQVDHSHVSGGHFNWPFTIASPTASVSSSSASSVTDSSLGHQSLNGHNTGNVLKFQLIVTIYRRGRLNRNIGFVITNSYKHSLTLCFGFKVKQKLSYVPPPDTSVQPSSPRSLSIDLLHDPPVAIPSWPKQNLPAVVVRGVMFRQVPVEVECNLVAPSSYPMSDIIPLSLTLTSQNREALDLFSVSNAIDVRLEKILAFGEHAAAVRRLSLKDRKSFHRVDLAAKASWQLDGHARELLTDQKHPRPRWCIELNGSLHRESKVEFCPSFEEPGMALVYFVSLFPFRSKDFRPASKPKKALVIGKIQLTEPNRPTG